MKYNPTIGLEIHAELKTKTKMFCACRNDPDEKRPNVNICPVCMGHPGTLPVPNKEAIKHVLKVGLGLGGKANNLSEFDRKNYFYPDIPKGYQISQYKNPLIVGGELAGVSVTRVHLEEDTARSLHVGDSSLVDFNRAGVPLMELVTEPVMHSSKEAVEFGKELQLLLQYLEVAEANMEKGEIRFEANISVSSDGKLGTKVEVKNLNSFRSVERAIEYEIARQAQVLEEGGKVAQETRGWNDVKEETYSQRSKEDSHDYRYFPDPDIPKFSIGEINDFDLQALKKEMPETPNDKRKALGQAYGLELSHVEFYVRERGLGALFEGAASLLEHKSPDTFKTLSNYIVNDVAGIGGMAIRPEDLAVLVGMIKSGEVSSRGAKEVLAFLGKGEKDPKSIAEKHGLVQKSDNLELLTIVKAVLEGNKGVVTEYKGGKTASLQFLVGQCMKASKGSGNPLVFKEILEKELKA